MISQPSKILPLLYFLAITSAAPQGGPNYPATSQSTAFKLIAKTRAADLTPSIQNWELTSYHTSPCLDYAVLAKPGSGRTFYVNGTAAEVRYNTANILSDGGTPPIPYGIVVPAAAVDPQQTSATATNDGRRAVSINCGPGTSGVGIAHFPEPVPRLVYGSGSFFACNASLPFGPAVALFYSEALTTASLVGCVGVELLPQCVVDGAQHPWASKVGCYDDDVGGTSVPV